MKPSRLLPSGVWKSRIPYLILDARYEKAREESVIRSQAYMLQEGRSWVA